MFRKNRKEEINYKNIIQTFLEKNEAIAFIPNNQRDTNRYHWHSAAEELDVDHKTLKLWTKTFLCGQHDKPIIGIKPEYVNEFDIELIYSREYAYECNYECSYEEGCYSNCCYEDDDGPKLCKMRTIVIFNKEGTKMIKDMRIEQIKDFLVKEGIIKIVNNKYTI